MLVIKLYKYIKMKQILTGLLFISLCISCAKNIGENNIFEIKKYWKFAKGDNMEWAKAEFDDAKWDSIMTGKGWNDLGLLDYDGYGWYRTKIVIPSSLKHNHNLTDSLLINIGYINDFNQVYLNGNLIGENHKTIHGVKEADTLFKHELYVHSGSRSYVLATNDKRINWDKENTIAIRIFDLFGDEGLFSEIQTIRVKDINDYIGFDNTTPIKFIGDSVKTNIVFVSKLPKINIEGKLSVQVILAENKTLLFEYNSDISVKAGLSVSIPISIKAQPEAAIINATFKPVNASVDIKHMRTIPYILTPKAKEDPKINNPKAFGVRPNKPILFNLAVSGMRPMTYEAENLPKGVVFNKLNGRFSGSIKKDGVYKIKIIAKNTFGKSESELHIIVGEKLALTPPMGWNSWNCWGLTIDQNKILEAGKIIVKSGLVNYGYLFVNIDDGWADPVRTKNGEIQANYKFPNIKALGDSLHNMGLKFGIYTSPGPATCGNCLGSYLFEKTDAKTFANWGVDFLKHDYCKYAYIANHSTDVKILQEPYMIMGTALRQCNRDIIYSICQYGLGDVWNWGAKVGGHLWRTTYDIRDNWTSLHEIGFTNRKNENTAGPGGWNDPDMLIVGRLGLGYGPDIHNTYLTPDEQYTHLSLWVLQAAPLLIGCDLNYLDDFTMSLLTNTEVLDINQDLLGKQGYPIISNNNYQVWIKDLEDGSKAIGIFNLKNSRQQISIRLSELGFNNSVILRDLWRNLDKGIHKENINCTVEAHGVTLYKAN